MGFWKDSLKNTQQIRVWNRNLARSWDLFYTAPDMRGSLESMMMIEHCYRKLDALGALGVPSN